MSQIEKYGFVYIWYDRKHKRFYIGSHYGTINDGYICSSSWMKQAYKHRPQDFKRRILKTNIERKNLLDEEYKWLQYIPNEGLGKRYYNLRNTKFEHWQHNEEKRLSIGQKISLTTTGRKRQPHSEETKQKIREKTLGKIRTDEHKDKIRQVRLGTKQSQATIDKKIKATTGKKRSEEFKKKMSLIALNRSKNKCL